MTSRPSNVLNVADHLLQCRCSARSGDWRGCSKPSLSSRCIVGGPFRSVAAFGR
jgi:hypothetical protein